jgi:hydroxymethylpyrimidine/phosphomethylpyrimidine kinase
VTTVLVIAGSDSSGGAGVAQDVRTLTRFGVQALCTLTAVTAQSDTQLSAVHLVPPQMVSAQMQAALGSGRVRAIKIGMLGTRATVLAVAAHLPPRAAMPLVLDPVLSASAGGELLDAAGRAALIEWLLPRATLITPNIPEAAALLASASARSEEELLRQGAALLALGPEAVLLKGGHGSGAEATDWLFRAGEPVRPLAAARIAATRRGTGCALAAAIAAGLATGLELHAACARAKQHVTELLQHGD